MSFEIRCTPIALAVALLVGAPGPARPGDAPPVTARSGEDLARAAAEIWAADARLIYVENDQGLTLGGGSGTWGYLFYSPSEDACRAYSIRDDEIIHAEDLEFAFDAPPLPATWIDSAAALDAAEQSDGAQFRKENGGTLRSMFLVRGLFHPSDPDAATWAFVYGSPTVPGLWVIVDAESGKVVRRWRG
jgi:hypothetical protein